MIGRLALIGVVLAAAGCGGETVTTTRVKSTSGPSSFSGQPVLSDARAADFALHDESGRTVRLSAERGHVVILTFLYTECRDICPLIADNLAVALDRLGGRGVDVRILAVSVDPVNDTPAAARAFIRAHRLGRQFHYLVGSHAELAPVWQAYNVLSTRRNESVVDHSAPTLLIDRNGRPRVYFTSGFGPTAVAHDVRVLLG